MKSFVEEYGKVIIVAIVMVALIAIAILFANGGTDSLKSIFTNFGLRAGFPNYEMIEAPKTINAGETARFVSEAKFGKFVEVQIDGKKVEPANYTSEGDTTKITLKAEYTDTMEAGKHTIDVISNDGFARAEFSVKFFGAVFSDGQKLGWSELQKSANGRKYGYKSHYITDTALQNQAFSRCTSLTSITIPDSVTSIGMDAFSNCTSLTSITIPKEITIINSDTFLNCSSLESVTLSNKVDTFDDGSFQNCINLKEFNYSGTKSEWKSIYKDNGAYQHGWLDGVTTSNIVVHCSDGDRGIYN